MTDDLFDNTEGFITLPLKDAEIQFLRFLPLDGPAESIIASLVAEVPWRAEQIVVWGKAHSQPRLIAWYGEAGRTYTYSGIRLEPLPWTDLLRDIKGKVEAVVGTPFNSVLLNYYRDNRDSMGFHSDDERELGDQPIIASLSLGDERTFVLKHKTEVIKAVHLVLPSNSLLVMKGDTQKNWKHGIQKEKRSCSPRINLTFRQIH